MEGLEYRLKPASEFIDEVVERFYPSSKILPGYPVTWSTVPIRVLPAELSVWAGINGHGKSQIMGQVVLMAAMAGEKTAIASFEMPAPKTLHRMARQAIGKQNPAHDEIRDCLHWLGDYVTIYDYVGRGQMPNMLHNFTLAAETEGCSQFVIDSLMKCGLAEDAYSDQKFLVEDFHNFAMSNKVHVHLIAHARKLKDEKDKPGKMDISGSSGITNVADNVYTVWRNKAKEHARWEFKGKGQSLPYDFDDSADAILECVKSREFGGEVEQQYRLWFEPHSQQYCECKERVVYAYYGDTPPF